MFRYHESLEKPPKNLNRMRAGKGAYGTANIPIASMANQGQLLNSYDARVGRWAAGRPIQVSIFSFDF